MSDEKKYKEPAGKEKPAKAEKVQRAEPRFHVAIAGSGNKVWRSEDGTIIKPFNKDAA